MLFIFWYLCKIGTKPARLLRLLLNFSLLFVADIQAARINNTYVILEISGLAADACSLSLVYDALRFKSYTDIEVKVPVIRQQLLKERRDAASRLEHCLHQIRQESGYERFLLEPTLDELQQSAKEGPIVILNATDLGCDAIIVSASEFQAISLPKMNSPHAPPLFHQSLARYRAIRQCNKYERDIENDLENEQVGPRAEAELEHMSRLWFKLCSANNKEIKGRPGVRLS